MVIFAALLISFAFVHYDNCNEAGIESKYPLDHKTYVLTFFVLMSFYKLIEMIASPSRCMVKNSWNLWCVYMFLHLVLWV